MQHLNKQMAQWSDYLQKDVKVGAQESLRLATTIKNEVHKLSEDVKIQIIQSDESKILLKNRLQELDAFQQWMDGTRSLPTLPPETVRAQVIVQNYICFVYLGESCFKALKKYLPVGSTTKKIILELSFGLVNVIVQTSLYQGLRCLKSS